MEGFVAQTARFALAATLLLSSIAKLGSPIAFRTSLSRFELLPAGAIAPVAFWLPRVELTLGVMLGVGLVTWFAASLALVLLAVLTFAVTINLVRGREIDCGCFGPFSRSITWWTLTRNVSLIGLGLVALLGSLERRAVGDAGDILGAESDALGALISGTSLVLVWLVGAEAIQLRRRLRRELSSAR